MTFNISNFSSQINKHGLSVNNLFVAKIFLPFGLRFIEDKLDTNSLTFFCRAVNLPSISIDGTQIQTRSIGPTELRPNKLDFPDLSTIFMVDSNYGVLKFFQQWMQQIVNYDVSAGYRSASPGGLLPYEVGYPDDYECSIEITAYSGHQEDKFYTYKFYRAFPSRVNDIELAWDNNAEILTLPVTFSYSELKVDATDRGTVLGQINRAGGPLGFLASLDRYGSAIRGIELPTNVQDAVNLYTDVNDILGSLT